MRVNAAGVFMQARVEFVRGQRHQTRGPVKHPQQCLQCAPGGGYFLQNNFCRRGVGSLKFEKNSADEEKEAQRGFLQ
jgi:hypothetical protein